MASVPVERTGVVRDEKTGETFIPASKRPDGTWRKPRRVKDGYIPQEEVPVYESKGIQWLNSMPTLPPGLNPVEKPVEKAVEKQVKIMKKPKKSSESQKQISVSTEFIAKKMDSVNLTDSQKKATMTANSTEEEEFKVITSKKSKSKNASKISVATETKTKSNSDKKKSSKLKPVDNTAAEAQTDPTKRLRNLKKKIRQIEELEEKIRSKDLPNPSQEQLEKVSRKKEVLKEIEKLELII